MSGKATGKGKGLKRKLKGNSTPDVGEVSQKKGKAPSKKLSKQTGARSSPLTTRSKGKQLKMKSGKSSIPSAVPTNNNAKPDQVACNILQPSEKELSIKRRLNMETPFITDVSNSDGLQQIVESVIPPMVLDTVEPGTSRDNSANAQAPNKGGKNASKSVVCTDNISDQYRDVVRTSVTQSEDECYQDTDQSSDSDEASTSGDDSSESSISSLSGVESGSEAAVEQWPKHDSLLGSSMESMVQDMVTRGIQ